MAADPRRRAAPTANRRRTVRFGTKAETLERLATRVRSAAVPDLIHFTVERWQRRRTECIRRIAERFHGDTVIVRSSALVEDSAASSYAGRFDSVPGVAVDRPTDIEAAIDRVVASMTGNPGDQVLVQPMLREVTVSGVILTYDLVHGAPYYVINYDDESGRTDSVTGGRGVHKALRVYRNAAAAYVRSPRIARFLDLARELERLCGETPLDIEFALTRNGDLYLLQVRRIAAARGWHPVTERRVSRQLVFVESYVRECSERRPGLFGRRTILAVMPDWNPAEMIGATPRPMAASLYRELITRHVWREARAFMGYRHLPPEELMVLLNSHPYVDVRASFNSFLPKDVAADTGEALVDAWLDRLDAHPELHDKVEFEVALTCLDFDFDGRMRRDYAGVLSPVRRRSFRDQLQLLTHACLRLEGDGSLALALAVVATLDAEGSAAHREPAQRDTGGLRRAVRLIRSSTLTGTFAFAVIARHAFIAEALLRSAVQRGAVAEERLDVLRRSVVTITGGMLREYAAVGRGRMARAEFLDRYGHLRPGTYDITSLRYDERDDLFADTLPHEQERDRRAFGWSRTEHRALASLLREAGFHGVTPGTLLEYARRAIAGREHAKFVFTRSLSDALRELAGWGESQGLSRDDLSFVDWEALERHCSDPAIDYTDRHFLGLADEGRRRHAEAHAFRLSHLVLDVRDIYVATIHRSEPNFVGKGRAAGVVAILDAQSSGQVSLYGCVACIENADPGFDWVFTRGIVALVTKFGGINSHMSIRRAELGIPAAIGCGEQTFERLRHSAFVEIDCTERLVRPVRVT